MSQILNHFKSILVVIPFIAFTTCQFAEGPHKKPPNILFIMSDDHSEKAISAYGHDLLETPNIDRIASGGILFKNSFVTNSICAPSRAVLLTGKYSHLNGLRDNRDKFDGSQLTFPKLLQKAGYSTAIVGKWHLKTEPTGFDYWNILIGQGQYYNPRMIEQGDTVDLIGYTTDIITDKALKYLRARDTSKPFCLLYHHKAPHRNWMPHPKYFALFKNKEIPLPKTFYDNYNTRTSAASEQDMRIDDMFLSQDMKLQPGFYEEETGTGGGHEQYDAPKSWARTYGRLTPEQKKAWDAHYDPINNHFREANLSGKSLSEWKYRRYMEDYLASIASVDENIGKVLDYLEEQGLSENTLVIYTSDQGFYLGEHGWYDKRFMYEESLKMPLLMKLPSEIPPAQISDALVLNLDFAPTILDYAGINAPNDFQGHSFRNIAQGNTPENWRKSIYYEYFEYPHGWHNVKRHYGVRTKRYKLIHFYGLDEWELYDLKNDPDELNNIYNEPSILAIRQELHMELIKLKKEFQVNHKD